MSNTSASASLGSTVYLGLTLVLGAYFGFAAIQGQSGVLAQRKVAAELEVLTTERDALVDELSQLQNLTLRLSDTYLDLDLLDERARAVLGYKFQEVGGRLGAVFGMVMVVVVPCAIEQDRIRQQFVPSEFPASLVRSL